MEEVVWEMGVMDWVLLETVSVQTVDIPCHTGGDRCAIN